MQELYVGKQYLHEVSYNAYNFYLINLTSLLLPNYSQITVRLNEVSGSVLMLSSTTISDPTFDMLTNSTDIEFSWDSIAYLLDSNDSVLYFSVFGSTEAIYYLQSTVVTDVDVPERYYKLSDATPN